MEKTEGIIYRDLESILKRHAKSGALFTIEQLTEMINKEEPRYGLSDGRFRPGELVRPLRKHVAEGNVENIKEVKSYRWILG